MTFCNSWSQAVYQTDSHFKPVNSSLPSVLPKEELKCWSRGGSGGSCLTLKWTYMSGESIEDLFICQRFHSAPDVLLNKCLCCFASSKTEGIPSASLVIHSSSKGMWSQNENEDVHYFQKVHMYVWRLVVLVLTKVGQSVSEEFLNGFEKWMVRPLLTCSHRLSACLMDIWTFAQYCSMKHKLRNWRFYSFCFEWLNSVWSKVNRCSMPVKTVKDVLWRPFYRRTEPAYLFFTLNKSSVNE